MTAELLHVIVSPFVIVISAGVKLKFPIRTRFVVAPKRGALRDSKNTANRRIARLLNFMVSGLVKVNRFYHYRKWRTNVPKTAWAL